MGTTVVLPNPELYIVLNGVPTKVKVVWRSLANIDHIKVAITKLKEINWLYRDVADDSIDAAAKQVIEVGNGATSTMLEKATEDDIVAFQAFTIRNLDNRESTACDIDQYKLLSVREQPGRHVFHGSLSRGRVRRVPPTPGQNQPQRVHKVMAVQQGVATPKRSTVRFLPSVAERAAGAGVGFGSVQPVVSQCQ